MSALPTVLSEKQRCVQRRAVEASRSHQEVKSRTNSVETRGTDSRALPQFREKKHEKVLPFKDCLLVSLTVRKRRGKTANPTRSHFCTKGKRQEHFRNNLPLLTQQKVLNLKVGRLVANASGYRWKKMQNLNDSSSTTSLFPDAITCSAAKRKALSASK